MGIQKMASSFNTIQQVLTKYIVYVWESQAIKVLQILQKGYRQESWQDSLTITQKVSISKLSFNVCL